MSIIIIHQSNVVNYFKSKWVDGNKLSRDNFEEINFGLFSKVSTVTKIVENTFLWDLKIKIKP